MAVTVVVIQAVRVAVRARHTANLTDPAMLGVAELGVKDITEVAQAIATTNVVTHRTAVEEALAVMGVKAIVGAGGQARFRMEQVATMLEARGRHTIVRHAIQVLARAAANTVTATAVLELS